MVLENKYMLLGGILILIVLILIILKYILKPKEDNEEIINESLDAIDHEEQEFAIEEDLDEEDPNYKTEYLDVDSMKNNNEVKIEKPIEVNTVTVSIKGEKIGTFNLSDDSTIVGRDPSKATIIISDAIVSKTHLKITPDGENFILEDLNSTNGTYVNGEQINKEKITTDDIILIGKKGNILIRFN